MMQNSTRTVIGSCSAHV